MKKFVILTLMFCSIVVANEELEQADVEFVKETYEFCLSIQEPDAINDKEILNCINEDLRYSNYKTFPSMAAVKAYINNESPT